MSLTPKEIEQKVIQILADSLNIDAQKIKPESKLVEDLGIDSFGAVELVFELREKFSIEIPQKDMAKIQTVNDLIGYIYKKGKRKRSLLFCF